MGRITPSKLPCDLVVNCVIAVPMLSQLLFSLSSETAGSMQGTTGKGTESLFSGSALGKDQISSSFPLWQNETKIKILNFASREARGEVAPWPVLLCSPSTTCPECEILSLGQVGLLPESLSAEWRQMMSDNWTRHLAQEKQHWVNVRKDSFQHSLETYFLIDFRVTSNSS